MLEYKRYWPICFWFHVINFLLHLQSFVADNVPCSATRFLQTLVKVSIQIDFQKKTSLGGKRRLRTVVLIPWLLMQERQELAERVMITRLTLYGRWIKVWILWLVISWTSKIPIHKFVVLLSHNPLCRNAIMEKYTMRYQTKTWSWCERGS